jgi:hypothetical protein
MATFNLVAQHAGELWAWLMGQWPAVAAEDTSSIGFSYTGITFGSKTYLQIQIEINTTAGDNFYFITLLDTQWTGSNATLPMHYVASLPGWNTVPPFVQESVGARDNNAYFRTHLWEIKKTVFSFCTDGVVQTDENIVSGIAGANTNTQTYYAAFQCGAVVCIVMQQAFMKNTGSTYDPLNGSSMYNAYSEGNPGAGSAGGGSVDLTPVVAALNDIAMIDVDYTANNGSAVFSMRGKVNV